MSENEHSNQRVTVRKTRSSGNRIVIRLIAWAVGFIVVLLAFRFSLMLLGANPDAAFVELVYGLSTPFVTPFAAVFGQVETGIGAVFDWNTLLAILVYAVVGWGAISLIRSVGHSTARTVEEVSQYEEIDRTDVR
ncbi:MAG TPA: YggT family protein [Coriobacteriia bacterium]|nr:YggT family protein [Coriobacteriia bacterium]